MIGRHTLDDALPAGASVLVDTSVVLAYLTGGEAISDLAVELFDRCIATGRNPAAISMVTVTELLVRPFRSGSSAVATVEAFIRHFGDMRLVPVDYDTAREAARMRAVAGFSAPDSLIVATAVTAALDVLVTNDGSWPALIRSALPGQRICVLQEVLAGV